MSVDPRGLRRPGPADPDPRTREALVQHRLAAVGRSIQGHVDRKIQRVEQATAGIRQVEVLSRDPATRTCTVRLDGDPDGDPAPCGLLSTSVVPVVGQQGWAIANGTDLVLAGMRAVELPKAKLRSTRVQTASTLEVFSYNNAEGLVAYDSDGMASMATSRLTCQWPGTYTIGAKTYSDPSGVTRPQLQLQMNGNWLLDADHGVASDSERYLHVDTRKVLAVGDYVQMLVGAGVATDFGNATNELGSAIWMEYLP